MRRNIFEAASKLLSIWLLILIVFSSYSVISEIRASGIGSNGYVDSTSTAIGASRIPYRRSVDEAVIDIKDFGDEHSCSPGGYFQFNFSVEEFVGIDVSLVSTSVTYYSLCREIIYGTEYPDFSKVKVAGGEKAEGQLSIEISKDMAKTAFMNGDDGVLLRINIQGQDENGNSLDFQLWTKVYIESKVAVLVDDNVLSIVRNNLDRYYSDIQAENEVEFIEISDSWNTPEAVRQDLISLWENESIIGAILVGDLPFAMWEIIHTDGSIEPAPIPIFYEDLDAVFEDNDTNGFYNYHYWGENDGPEIWSSFLSPPSETIPTDHLRPSGSSSSGGLRATFYGDNNFQNQVLTRTGETIEYYFTLKDPPSPVPDDFFSIKWEGQVLIDRDDSYILEILYGGGVIIEVDGDKLFNDATSPPWSQKSERINIDLTKGWHDIKVSYRENGWGDNKGYIRLCWRSPTLVGDMLNKWFEKDHSYHTGEMDHPEEGLLFMDYCYGLQSNMMGSIKKDNLKPLYGDHLDCGGGEATTNATEYIEYLDKGHEITSIWSHSGGGNHQFQVDPDSGAEVTGANSYMIKDTKGSVVTLIWGCHAGDFAGSSYWLSASKTENLVVNYAFNTDYGLAALGCTRSYGTTFNTVYHDWKDGSYLGMGYFHYKDVGYDKELRMSEPHPLGEKMWIEDEVLFGDPFIRVDHFPKDPRVDIEEGSRFISDNTINVTIESEGALEMMFEYQGHQVGWMPFNSSTILTIDPIDGILEVQVFTRNGYGQSRMSGSDRIYIESTIPEILDFTINGGETITNNATVLLEMDLSDDLSGLDGMCFSNDGQNWSDWEECKNQKYWELGQGDGWKTVLLKVRDAVGNYVTDHRSIKIDQTGPRIWTDVLGHTGENGWYITDVAISFYSIDNDISNIMVRNDQGDWEIFEDIMYIFEDGTFSFQYYGIDDLGNVGTTNEITLNIDRTDPEIHNMTIEDNLLITNRSEIVLSINAQDPISGIDSMCFSRDGFEWGEWIEYNTTHIFNIDDDDGHKEIYLQIKDKAGNIGILSEPSVIELDATAPIFLGSSPENGETVDKNNTVSLFFSERIDKETLQVEVKDTSGKDVEVSIEMKYTARVDILFPLEGYLEYHVRIHGTLCDLAGNMLGDDITFNFTVTGSPPDMPLDLTTTLVAKGVLLQWSEPANTGDQPIIGYRIERKSGGPGWEEIGNTSDIHFFDENLSPGNEYLYRVVAYNGFEDSEPSFDISIVIPSEQMDDNDENNEDDDLEKENSGKDPSLSIWLIIVMISISVLVVLLISFLIASRSKDDSFEE